MDLLNIPLQSRVFLYGQAGSGKTTAAVQHMLRLVEHGIPAESILILVPQRSLGQPFYQMIHSPDFNSGGEPSILTIGGLAQRMLILFWPMVAKEAGFTSPQKPPTFLTLETAQYFLAGLVEPLLQKGYFESITVDPNRLYSQILDNLNKSAVGGFQPEEIAAKLTQAWSGKPSQAIIYEQAQECALLFRQFCLERNLLDFSLQTSVFSNHLWKKLLCNQYLKKTYRHLIYDNAEEDYPVAHNIIESWLPDFESALIISDTDAGFRLFMGADPSSVNKMVKMCDPKIEMGTSWIKSSPLDTLEKTLSASLIQHRLDQAVDLEIEKAFSVQSFRFFPQLIDWLTQEINHLTSDEGILPSEIAVLTPFLSDSMRYTISSRFADAGIQMRTIRPSRGLKNEPAINAILTLVKLAFPTWGSKPTRDEVRNTMLLILSDCDYIRADLISQVLYHPQSGSLRSFDPIKKEMQQRLTYTIGERFESLRKWLEQYAESENQELDIFISKLFGEKLSQPGYKFHDQYDAASAVNRLVESARKFRQAMTDNLTELNKSVNQEYIRLVENGTLSAQYLSDWNSHEFSEAVLVSPAFSFLMNNQPCKIQFWLDIGSQGWWTRLDQPLTHPYVLNPSWPVGKIWTDLHEHNANQQSLMRITSGLIRRCSGHIYMCSLAINEQGNEERGALMMGVQTILRKLNTETGGSHV